MKKLFIISGGVGNEREVSLASGKSCTEILRNSGIFCEEIFVNQDKTFVYKDKLMTEDEGLLFLKKENALVFQLIHGTYGEDGYLVRKLEQHNIPYIGSSSGVLEKTINKYVTEILLRENDIATTDSILIRSVSDIVKIKEISFPIIIKPNKEGSSVGVIKVEKEFDLALSLEKSLELYGEVLVQKCFLGREFTCGVIEMHGEEKPLVPSEVVLENGMIFDYNAKYFVNGLEITPANTDDEMTKKIQNLALRVHTITGCKDISRTDMILDEEGELVVLEINTVPGMTEVSFVPAEMKASGYSLKEFIEGMIKKYC